MDIKQIPCNPKNYSSTKRALSDIKYIVIHYVGAEGGSTANGNYYGGGYVGSSAHYYVGHAGEPYVQSVPDNCVAWHCGTANGAYKQIHKYCRNSNSIGIELCCWNKNDVWTVDSETVQKAIELTEYLMKKYNISKSNVIRHYDVTHKSCPAFWVNNTRWKKEFWNKLNNQSSSNKPSLVKKVTTTIKNVVTKTPSKTGYVKVLINNLSIRNKASWDENAVCGKVKKDEVFTVVKKVKVGTSYMYLLKSGKFITASESYVMFYEK